MVTRSPTVPLAVAVAIVLAGTAILTAADRQAPLRDAAPGASAAAWDATVLSFDGTPIAITVYRPEGATADAPVPLILHSHGWSGSRIADGRGIVGRLWAEGYGVVSVDARGHGESGGASTVHHADYEVRDFQAVLDWVHDELAWVAREAESGVERDLVAGATGYSYGGAIQWQLASRDGRLDAIAPEYTWTDLAGALAPEGVVKSVWVHALYGMAKESGTRIDPRIDGWYRETMTTNALPQDALLHFEGSDPVLERVDADVLMLQGIPDVLFNLNQALAAYETLEAQGGRDVRLFTHLTGHVLPTQPLGTSPERRMPFEDETPCGSTSALVVAWFDEKLRGKGPSGIPEVSLALDDGECVTLDAWAPTAVAVHLPVAPAPSAAGSAFVPLLEGPALVAGVPRLQARGGDLAQEGVVFVGLAIAGADGHVRLLDDQTHPVRVHAGAAIDVDLAGVAGRLHEGERLLLRIDGLNEWYSTNGARAPGGGLLTDVTVLVPLVEGA